MHKPQLEVTDFHIAMGLKCPMAGMDIDWEDLEGVRWNLIREEASEFEDAIREQNLPDTVDALCDLLYVVYGAAVSMGIDLEPHFNLVHRANMSKLGGKKRADGKQLKPANWEAPDHRPLLDGRV